MIKPQVDDADDIIEVTIHMENILPHDKDDNYIDDDESDANFFWFVFICSIWKFGYIFSIPVLNILSHLYTLIPFFSFIDSCWFKMESRRKCLGCGLEGIVVPVLWLHLQNSWKFVFVNISVSGFWGWCCPLGYWGQYMFLFWNVIDNFGFFGFLDKGF